MRVKKKYVILSIIETVLNPVFGIVSLILCFYLDAILTQGRDVEQTRQAEQWLRITLWAGFILFAIVFIPILIYLFSR